MEKIGNAPIVGEAAREYLNERRFEDYYEYKERLLRWLHSLGKNPERTEGYADSTVANVSYNIARFHLWNWKETGTYGTKPTVDRADVGVEIGPWFLVAEKTRNDHDELSCDNIHYIVSRYHGAVTRWLNDETFFE